MKRLMVLIAIVAYAAAANSQTPNSPPEPFMHTQTAFDLVVHASYAETAPLFGPEGERPWAGKHWDPQFIHPQPAHDEEDAVFTIRHGPSKAVWVTALYDIEGRHFKYVYFLDGLLVTTIDVRFHPIDASSTAVHVVYTRTALTPQGNDHIVAMTEGDKSAGADWQSALNSYLESRKR